MLLVEIYMLFGWTCHMSDEDDLRFQAYVSMAFGIRNFTHFTYKTSELYGQGLGYTQACVNKDGTINDLYYDAQAVNRELLSLDHVYLSYDYVGTKCFVGTENESGKNTAFDRLEYGLRELEGISSVTCTQDTVIGALKDETGRRGFVVVNYTEPTAEKSDTVEITVPESVRSYAVYSKGEWSRLFDAALLAAVHRLGRPAEGGRPPGLHLDEDQVLAARRDDVDLSGFASEIPVQDLIAVQLQEPDGKVFAALTQLYPVVFLISVTHSSYCHGFYCNSPLFNTAL